MRKSLYALFLLLGINVWGQEQEIEPINTDRPDQNEGTYVLPKGIFQIEGGLQYSEGGICAESNAPLWTAEKNGNPFRHRLWEGYLAYSV